VAQEVRGGHPWNGDILIRRSDVEEIIRKAAVTRLTEWEGS
jgi:hypothetical protein